MKIVKGRFDLQGREGLTFFFLSVCVCVCLYVHVMYAHMSECAGMRACVQACRTQDRMPDVFFALRVTALWQGLLLNQELTIQLG